jgi:hypothetical protein
MMSGSTSGPCRSSSARTAIGPIRWNTPDRTSPCGRSRSHKVCSDQSTAAACGDTSSTDASSSSSRSSSATSSVVALPSGGGCTNAQRCRSAVPSTCDCRSSRLQLSVDSAARAISSRSRPPGAPSTSAAWSNWNVRPCATRSSGARFVSRACSARNGPAVSTSTQPVARGPRSASTAIVQVPSVTLATQPATCLPLDCTSTGASENAPRGGVRNSYSQRCAARPTNVASNG